MNYQNIDFERRKKDRRESVSKFKLLFAAMVLTVFAAGAGFGFYAGILISDRAVRSEASR